MQRSRPKRAAEGDTAPKRVLVDTNSDGKTDVVIETMDDDDYDAPTDVPSSAYQIAGDSQAYGHKPLPQVERYHLLPDNIKQLIKRLKKWRGRIPERELEKLPAKYRPMMFGFRKRNRQQYLARKTARGRYGGGGYVPALSAGS